MRRCAAFGLIVACHRPAPDTPPPVPPPPPVVVAPGGGHGPEPEPEHGHGPGLGPESRPERFGEPTHRALPQVGGVTLTAPAKLAVEERTGEATLSADGFPTVTIRLEAHTGSTGLSIHVTNGDVRVRREIPGLAILCQADDTAEHEDAVKALCVSIAFPVEPRLTDVDCSADGFKAKAVRAAWQARAADLRACGALEPTVESFTFVVQVDRTRSKFGGGPLGGRSAFISSAEGVDEAVGECFQKVADAFNDAAAFRPRKLPARAKCRATFWRH